MKKILSLILVAAMLTSSTAVFAAETAEVENEPAAITEVAPEFISDKRVVEGTVKSVSEGQIEIEDLALNIDENTLVADTDLVPTEVKEGDIITAIASTMTTRSIPAQSYAYYIIVRPNAETAAPIYMTVKEVKDGLIVSEDGNYEVSYENAEVAMYRTKNIVKAEELTKGSEIFVYADVMTMSIPALVNPTKIVVKSIAQDAVEAEKEETQEEEPAAVVEMISDKRVVEGTVKSVSEGQIEIEDLALNIDENTLVADTDLVPTEVKEGDIITAIASTMTTFSIPAQSYAYYIIVRPNAETAAPIYMTVKEVKDGLIVSEDGNYEVSYENAEVAMYRTKNIVKAEELTKGSEIFVYADVMTMSIPALVNPTKIVIMNIAEPSKAEALNQQGILLGTENGLELEREVSRAEAVALIQRTTPSAKMVYTSDFTDVPEDHWAYTNISWAAETKIVAGVGDGKFEPDRTVTARELAMMLLNAMNEESEYEKAFEIALEKGLVTEDDGILADDTLTREATANMIYNYLNK